MKLDRVHDLQDVFRKMVTAHSFPGRILSIESVMSGIDKDLPLPAHLCVIALTLLDAETGFAVVSARSDEQVRLISQLTYARSVPLDEADFLFAKSGDEYVLSALDAAKEGTLEDPHKGATVIMEVAGMCSDDPANYDEASGADEAAALADVSGTPGNRPFNGDSLSGGESSESFQSAEGRATALGSTVSTDWPEWILTGPGIETEKRLRVAGSPKWAEIRAVRNKEFPLGVDCILIDPTGRMAALPRTTKMKRVEEGAA